MLSPAPDEPSARWLSRRTRSETTLGDGAPPGYANQTSSNRTSPAMSPTHTRSAASASPGGTWRMSRTRSSATTAALDCRPIAAIWARGEATAQEDVGQNVATPQRACGYGAPAHYHDQRFHESNQRRRDLTQWPPLALELRKRFSGVRTLLARCRCSPCSAAYAFTIHAAGSEPASQLTRSGPSARAPRRAAVPSSVRSIS